tara:strand:- start:6023 stop:6385 length:363 start_codon:yes stop_codon:yes gene_type:complete
MKYIIIFMISALASSCSDYPLKLDDLNLGNVFSTDYEEVNQAPKDAIQFQCAENKNFYLKYLDEKNAVWIFFKDREFRLDKTKDEEDSYTNETTRLDIKEGTAIIKAGATVLYDQCQKKS